MSKVTKSTNAPVSVTPKETSVSKQESNLPNIDPALATLMGVAAVVSGVMSYRGAIEIFNSELMGLGFTIVVQGIVTIVLWYLALATTTQRIILMFVWAVAVTFSIGTAFITTDKANDGRDVDVAINQLATYEASIAAKNTEMKQQMAHKDREAEAEEKGLRGSPPGCGTICESLKQESRALASRVDVFETDVLPALKKAQKAREGLSQTASLADVDAIFKDLKLSTQAFAKDVPEPSFVGKTTKGVFDRLGDAVDTVTQGSAGDATSITSALWVASLMEILALGCAIIRYCARLRLDIGALFNDFESLLAFAYNLKGLPQRVSTLALRKETEWQDAFNKEKAARAKSNTGKGAKTQMPGPLKNDQEYWLEGLFAQSEISEIPMARLILELQADICNVKVDSPLEGKEFAKRNAIQNVLINTGVLTHGKNGLVPNQKWLEWNAFLFEEFRRQRQPAQAKRSLKVARLHEAA